MGKGGNKFRQEAVAQRVKQRGSFTNAELKKNMQVYLETGKHPAVEEYSRKVQDDKYGVPALPLREPTRQHVYMDLAYNSKPLDRLVFELFDDYAPKAALYVRGRLGPGASRAIRDTDATKLLPGFAVYFGAPKTGVRNDVERCRQLRSTQEGLLLAQRTGDHLAISLTRSLPLDEEYQVAGRVHKGGNAIKLLQKLSSRPPDDRPEGSVRVVACGACDAEGVKEELGVGKGGVQAAGKALEAAAGRQRETVASAVAHGLAAAAKKGTGGGSVAGQKRAAEGGVGGAAAKKGRGMLDAVLGGDSGSGSESSSDDDS
ncbi:unnamed protein product [Pedinophyceae sp. YPF-701]|nr:unnamed protein product [Pedinophyceae sp. YPF-701]